MTARSFVVFQDIPAEPLPTIRADVSQSPSVPLIGPSILVLSPTPVTTAEKENFHPLTGARAGAPTDSQTKKRKNGILATKLHVPPTTKKTRDLAVVGTIRKTNTLSSSRSSNSGKLCHDKVTQAEVDSKCYALTVSPLADVSHAFDQVSISPTESRPYTSRILTPKKTSLSGERGSSPRMPVVGSSSPKKADIASEEAFFSTPERKQIYAAFTFTSPSPSAKRFVAPHLDIFGDIRFDP
ncbi:hypothetical protein F5148DRAFT_1283143 [Russula earlei]|uniref:Uncharacterized protein n=1 Tax=Russula earlei TaxID=71964 RepID=A0ACC0UEJ3_9AGAM|nr:hypothetical protein F5148DRAFT_1283143 [Russula earlei]